VKFGVRGFVEEVEMANVNGGVEMATA